MFTHLHVHTEYSMLDGISRIPDLVSQTKNLGMNSIAITDHGSLYGVVDFYSECIDQGIKPILGCEVYVAHNDRFDRSASERSPFHMVLLAKNNTGYKNLIQLVTKSHLEGFHYRPRIDKGLLAEYKEGLICLSGCPSAEVPKLITESTIEEAVKTAAWYKELFGENYFLELQRHSDVPMLPEINKSLVEIGKTLDIPLVVTNDSHYVHQSDAPFQDVYICIQTSTNIQDEKRLRMEDNSYYIKSPQEMQDLFSDYPEAIQNTQLIADMCNVELGFGQTHLPKYSTPNNISADDYLSELCWGGFKSRYPHPTQVAEDRLKYELEVIKYTQFANYFLVVWDIIDFVRRNNILFGVRGSAAASVALYCLGITEIDPLEYKLVFERFLNLERKEMPDIDMDFQSDRRDEVLHYVIDRYGSERVAQIITFGTMGAKASLRDVGRGLGMAYGDVDRIAKMVPLKSRTLADALKASQELQSTYETDEAVKILVDNAKGLEGIVHHVSTHAAGVLICDEPLTDTVPLQRPSKGDENSPVMMTQYSMDPVAKLGLLKMDFLGLTCLSVLDKTTKLIARSTGKQIDVNDLPLDDGPTFELLSSGKTTECFQLESAGMQRYIAELKPSNLGDIAAMIALYRPGPMEHIDAFISAKHGKTPISYPHESLKDLLDETYGIIVYQDQVLLILQSFAGYSLGEADTVRKAMGKKISSLMAQERERFIEGAFSKGFDNITSGEIFSLIEPFAGYAFNKAHSVSYALISYWTAYFKTHYPVEYMTSVLNCSVDNPDKVISAINESSKLHIPILLPNINRSEAFFSIENEDIETPSIRFGLAAVKTIGETAIRPIVEERKEKGPYSSIDNFCRRADIHGLNRRTIESLIKSGAFDNFGDRGAILESVDEILATAQMHSTMRNTGQTNMFDSMRDKEGLSSQPLSSIYIGNTVISDQEKATWEREFLGSGISYNPIADLINIDKNVGYTELSELHDLSNDTLITLIGHVSDINERYTREQKKFLVVNLELVDGSIELLIWPDILSKTDGLWHTGMLVKTQGKLRSRGEQLSISGEQAEEYFCPNQNESPNTPVQGITPKNDPIAQPEITPMQKNIKQSGKQAIVLHIKESDNAFEDAHLLRELVQLLLEYQGEDSVKLNILTNGRRILMDLPAVNTSYCTELKTRLETILGNNTVNAIPD
jgi:DNA polymerase-3 subunit alpha